MHGWGMDANSWFEIINWGIEEAPTPAALYGAGFDVWIGNNRGT